MCDDMDAFALPVGAQARLMSQALRKIAGNASKCNCTVIFLNQLRHKVQPHGSASCFGPCSRCAGGKGMRECIAACQAMQQCLQPTAVPATWLHTPLIAVLQITLGAHLRRACHA